MSDPCVRKIPWRRKWLPTTVFLPGEFHGQRSLAGYSPRGHKELDMTECITLSHASLQQMYINPKLADADTLDVSVQSTEECAA